MASPSRRAPVRAAAVDILSVGALTHSAPVLDLFDLRAWRTCAQEDEVLLAIDVGNTDTVIGLVRRRPERSRPDEAGRRDGTGPSPGSPITGVSRRCLHARPTGTR